MSEIMDDKTRRELKAILGKLPRPVKILFFTQDPQCPMCEHQEKVLREFASASDKVKLETYDFVKDREKVEEYKIEMIPATVVIAEKDYGIRFYGITAGYEFSTLLETVMITAAKTSGLDPEVKKLLRMVKEPAHLRVMVSPTCPYCPRAALTAFQFAMEMDNIRADMIEVSEYPHVAQKYSVQGVPKIVINETHSFEGALPVEMFLIEIVKAVDPEGFSQLEEVLREADPHRKAKKADAEHTYECVIVGGGPAALSAAVYAARKALDVLLLTKMFGGQIYYTAAVENYLGFPGIDGREMIERFKAHAEQYPIAIHAGDLVESIERERGEFLFKMEKGTLFRGKSVIYCAGKEYKRLGVPGEEQYIGRGIAFCATCDAPLFKGKTVAVVGGGNSALTAVRDLLPYAAKVHLIHRREEFTGDPVLLEALRKDKRVIIYTPWTVVEFTGTDRLRGLRMVKSDFSDMMDLKVDGVFLEIGLTPNSKPVKELMPLNQYGEIPVQCDNTTSVEGFFAAGDVTDVPEKQICVAVGEGGKAALSVNRYLQSKGLTGSVADVEDKWQ